MEHNKVNCYNVIIVLPTETYKTQDITEIQP